MGRVKNALVSAPSLHAPYSVPCGANCTSGESGIRKLFAFPWLREARSSNNWNTGCPVFRTVHSMRQIPYSSLNRPAPLFLASRNPRKLQIATMSDKSSPKTPPGVVLEDVGIAVSISFYTDHTIPTRHSLHSRRRRRGLIPTQIDRPTAAITTATETPL